MKFAKLVMLFFLFSFFSSFVSANGISNSSYFYLQIDSSVLPGKPIDLSFCGNAKLARLEIFKLNPLDAPLEKYLDKLEVEALLLKSEKIRSLDLLIQGTDYCKKQVLEPLTSGYYYFKAFEVGIPVVDSLLAEYNFVNVSSLGFIAKQSDSKTAFYVFDLVSGKPLQGAEVFSFKEAFKDAKSIGLTNELGLLEIDKGEEIQNVLASLQGNNAFTRTYYYASSYDKFQVYSFTDRPIYRPNQKVFFKSIAWQNLNGLKSFYSNSSIQVEISDSKGNSVFKQSFTSNEFGAISGEFVLGDEPSLGNYSLNVLINDQAFYSQGFEVQEYRKPEYKVSLTPSKKQFLKGDKIELKVLTEYFFGSPVPNADLVFEVQKDSSYFSPCWGYYKCFYAEEFILPPRYFRGQTVFSGQLKTDLQGEAIVSFDSNSLEETDVTYTVTVKAFDESRREASASTQVKVNSALFKLLGLTNKYSYSVGEEIKVKIKSIDNDNSPVNAKIDVNVSRGEWDANYSVYTIESIKFDSVESKEGVADYSFTVSKGGSYSIELTSKDEKGNPVKYKLNVYVYEAGRFFDKFDSLEISLDKDAYSQNDVAVLTINSPVKEFVALVSIEGKKLFYLKPTYSETNSKQLHLQLTPEMTLNAFVNVSIVKDNKMYSAVKRILIPPANKNLNVEITPQKDFFNPREKVQFRVKLTDEEGKPVKGELSLGLVDESIYSLKEDSSEDIFKFFYSPERNSVYTSSSVQAFYYPRGIEGEIMTESGMPLLGIAAPRMEKSVDSVRREFAATEIRNIFADTAFWNSSVKTNAEGEALVEVDLPDNLTTWRATVKALGTEMQVGQNTDKIVSRKKVIARLITPRFLVQGDELIISGIVHNFLPEQQEFLVQLDSNDLEFLSSNEKLVSIASNASQRIDFTVKASKCCSAKLALKSLGLIESDAMELTLPVLPHGVKQTKYFSGELKGNELVQEILFPEKTIAGADSVLISLNPSIAASMLDSLDYLTGYPYGCVEQTMSKFLPNLIVDQALKKLNLSKPELQKDLPDQVSKGLQRLYDFQHGDGGWGWWKDDQTNNYMTAYVVYGLSLAEQSGFNVDKSVLQRGVNKLEQLFAEETNQNIKAFMSYALSLQGINRFEGIKKEELSSYGKAVYALALWNEKSPEATNKPAERKQLAQDLVKELDLNGSCTSLECSWTGEGWRQHYSSNDVEATAYVLKALIAINPLSENIPKTINFLVRNKKGGRWVSTSDTAAAIFALTDYLVLTQELKPNYSLQVSFNNDLLSSNQINSSNVLNKFEFSPKVLQKNNSIKVSKQGQGKLYYAITQQFFELKDLIEAESNGIKITRSMPLEIDLGQEFDVNLLVELNADYEYLILEDFLPAGVELVDEKKSDDYYYWDYKRFERRDEKVVFFFSWLGKGQHSFSYRVRAEVPGTFKVLPTQSSLMYAPEINGRSSENTLKITENYRLFIPKIDVNAQEIIIILDEETLSGEKINGSIDLIVSDSNGVTLSSKSIDLNLSQPRKSEQTSISLNKKLSEGQYTVSLKAYTDKGNFASTKAFQLGRITVVEEIPETITSLSKEKIVFDKSSVPFKPDSTVIPSAKITPIPDKPKTPGIDLFKIIGGALIILSLIAIIYIVFLRKGAQIEAED